MRLSSYFVVAAACVQMAALGAGSKLDLKPGAPPTVEAAGISGDLVRIEAAAKLSDNWDLLSSVILTNDSIRWPDLWAGDSQQRFYRVTRSANTFAPFARNFRLLDHLGKSRELFYYAGAQDIKAFVLIFTANGCAAIQDRLPTLESLRQTYESKGVLFWMIDSQASDTRTGIAAEATRLGINFPILHDRAQSVAEAYKPRTAAEVICIDRETLSVFYRGAIDDRTGSDAATATRNFLDEALTAVLSGRSYNVQETKPAGCDMPPLQLRQWSYSSDVAPILQAKCVPCHRPGSIAPWSMTNYAIVQMYADAMKETILTKRMPPWQFDPEYGHFKNDISLSVDEEKTLVEWINAGAPRGSGNDPLEVVPPPPPKWPPELGEPDLIIRAPEQQVKATGVEPYRYIFVDTGLTNDTWLRAAIVRPSNPKVVHHYLVWEGASMSQMASGFAGYVPGTTRGILPDGVGIRLSGNTQITFNLHYTPAGEDAVDQPELALWFHKTPPAKELYTVPLLNTSFAIPPGAREHEVTAKLPIVQSLPYAGTLYSMSPHMHLRGKRMRFEVVYPDNRREVLLSVPNYEFHWQMTYELAEPKKIPAGSKLFAIGAFDNSDLNMENPDPSETVRWGEQSYEEMFIGYCDFTQD